MTIDDFVSNRWADAKEALRKLDCEFVDQLDAVVRLQRLDLWAPPDMYAQSEKPPWKRLPKEWHELLEECFELTVMIRNYQTCTSNMTSEAAKGMSDIEAGRLFMYSFYTWVLYQDAVIDHTKAVISLASKIYRSPKLTPNQLKKHYYDKANTLKRKATKEKRNAVAHGKEGFISQGLTEDQLWENNVVIGILPHHVIDNHYEESGRRVHSGYYDKIMSIGPQGFLEEISNLLHSFEKEIGTPS